MAGSVSFTGFAGRAYRAVTTDDTGLAVRSGRDVRTVSPTGAEWARFWSVVDSLRAWEWQPAYGDSIKDGAPWSIELQHGERRVATRGNELEDHAPVGIRTLVLALHALLAGGLLPDEDARLIAKPYRLAIEVPTQTGPASELTIVRRLMADLIRSLGERGIELSVRCYTFGPTRMGACFLLDEPLASAALGMIRDCLGDRDARIAMLEFATGQVNDL